MKKLHLALKKEWYAMIDSGEKKEKYIQLNYYWYQRLIGVEGNFKDFDTVVFSYGLTKKRMAFSIKCMKIGRGRIEWGAPRYLNVFIISLGDRLY